MRNDTHSFTPIDALELFEDAPCGYHALTADGEYLYVNRTEARWLGYEPAEITGRPCADFIAADSVALFQRSYQALVEEGQAIQVLALRLLRRDGSTIEVHLSVSAVRDASGAFRYAHATITEALPIPPTVAEQILDANPDLVLAWDMQEGRALYVNAPARSLLGNATRSPARPGRLPLEGYLPEEDLPLLRTLIHHIAAAHDGEACEAEFRVRVAPHIVRWLRCRGVALERGIDGNPVHILFIAQDVTERRKSELLLAEHARKFHQLTERLVGHQADLERRNARLTDLAATDGLTGLLNHVAFQERLEVEFRSARRSHRELCLLLLDIDYFKVLNDTWGHPAGDKALRSVAHCLRIHVRQNDILARYGGEEFAVILTDTTQEMGEAIAERFRRAVEAIPDSPQSLTVSVGLACLQPTTTDRDFLIAAADRALYSAKRRGRNCVVAAEEN